MRAQRTYAHVEEALAASRFDLVTKVPVLCCAELHAVPVRPPDQTAYVRTSLRRAGERVADLAARLVQQLIRVTAPVREHQEVTRSQRVDHLQEGIEVGGSVDQRANAVALGPCAAGAGDTVDVGVRVSALLRPQEPVRQRGL